MLSDSAVTTMLPVKDMDRARAFYEGRLGLKPAGFKPDGKFEEWFTRRACDGFVVGAASVPTSYEDFAKWVVPELQRRGLFQKYYKGTTLRENLGLPRPAVHHG